MKRYLGVICLLYSGIFGYVVFFDKIKMFLAPQMQIYIKLSIIPMFFIGLVMLFNNKVVYNFKISDLVLILPLVFLILSGDGRLTASFASNKITNFNTENKAKVETPKENINNEVQEKNNIEIDKNDNKEETKEDVALVSNNSFDAYFDVVDETYNELANYLTFEANAEKFSGKTIRVRGFGLTNEECLPKGYFALGKYVITCCAADAGFAGFIVKQDDFKIVDNKWYEVEGTLKKGKDSSGNDIMYIQVSNLKEIDSKSEEQYVYPCYSYDDGLCKTMDKYNLDY